MKNTSNKNVQLLSFIVPAKDEEATLSTLIDGIRGQAESLMLDWEVIFIDDGSTDGTWAEMTRLSRKYPQQVRSFRMRRNMGKADALSLGYAKAQGDIIFTMDADLQDDPNEIPRFIDRIEQGYDIVSGWKQKRFDPWHKVLPSRCFNALISKIAGVDLHDHNCGFKAYRRDVVKELPMYGEMHRMVPSLAAFEGYRTSELVVQHHPRRFGKSKYGVKRILCGLFDMTTVFFLKNYRNRPMHFFGRLAMLGGAATLLLWTLAIAAFAMGIASSGLWIAGAIIAAASINAIGQGLGQERLVYEQMKLSHHVPVAESTRYRRHANMSVVADDDALFVDELSQKQA